MRTKLYIDTSVIGAVCDPGSEDRMAATRRILDGFVRDSWEGYISTLVLEEIERAPASVQFKLAQELRRCSFTVLEESGESLTLAREYVLEGAVPARCEDDARHIAIATVNGIRIIVSWNFRHMVNIERKQKVNSVNLRFGLPLIDIVSPWEVRDEET